MELNSQMSIQPDNFLQLISSTASSVGKSIKQQNERVYSCGVNTLKNTMFSFQSALSLLRRIIKSKRILRVGSISQLANPPKPKGWTPIKWRIRQPTTNLTRTTELNQKTSSVVNHWLHNYQTHMPVWDFIKGIQHWQKSLSLAHYQSHCRVNSTIIPRRFVNISSTSLAKSFIRNLKESLPLKLKYNCVP